MCTHYAFTMSIEALRRMFNLSVHFEYPTRYNIAPNQIAPIIARVDAENAPLMARWGFARPGADVRPVNARAETVATSPLFKGAFRAHRCVVPASGFFEPRKKPGMKKGDQQWYFQADEDVLPLAGIYAPPEDENDPPTFAVITTEPDKIVGTIHQRMPAILARSECEAWLDTSREDAGTLLELLHPTTPDGFRKHRVNMDYVNRPSMHDGPECIEPVEHKDADADGQGTLFAV